MKKTKNILVALALIIAAGLTSCIKENLATEAPEGTANITVNVGSRVGTSDTDNSAVLANEGIKTIRLILVQDNKVVSNSLHEYTDKELLQQSIQIIGLKPVPTRFYAVVNEGGVNKDFEKDFAVNSPFDENAFNSAALVKIDAEKNGLPMAGEKYAGELKDGDNISIEVTRAVARIDLNVINETGSDLRVDQVNFGKFFPDKGFLVENPEEPTINSKPFREDQTIAANENNNEHVFTYYLYESLHGESYTVGMDGSTHYDLTPIIDKNTKQPVTSLPRNTILKVNATANPTGWELQCNVLSWEKDEVTVDFKDELSYVSEGWDENTILGMLEGNVVHVDPQKEALLTFTIQTPNTATWKAQLVGDQEAMKAFEFVDGINSGSIHYDENGGALPQELKIRISEDYIESQDEHQVTLKVFAKIAGKDYELDLTNTSDTPQKPDEGQIVNRYTLLQQK